MANVNLSDPIFQGEGKWFPFELVDEAGAAIDLSTATFVFQVKQALDDPEPLFSATEFDVSEAGVGKVKANLPASQTIGMAEGAYYAQLLTVIEPDTDVDISDLVKFKIKKPVVAAGGGA